MKLADKISIKLQEFIRKQSSCICLPNYFVGFYEMDVFRLLPNGMLYEYEIKISRADFKNDFKKGSKHSLMANKKGHANRFYFVTPEGLVHKHEIPEYAGLIEVCMDDDGEPSYLHVIKNAKIIHSEKKPASFYKDIATKVSFREVNWRWKLNSALATIKNLKNQINAKTT